MAVFECTECKGTVSDKAPACPHCGAPLDKPIAQSADTVSKPAKKPMGKGMKIILTLVGIFLVVSCIGGMNAPKNEGSSTTTKEPEQPKPMDRIEALTACQMLIQKAANDPEKADIPYIEGILTGDIYNFKWDRNTKLARMRNGLGNEVGVPAFCSINIHTREFTQLNINGQNIPLK